ncbi:hypothetical protein IL306_005567 [Fusarium sp. DS 682]|nr:hypothetical protein IL306_005567 [Fusarium sp. DS 682]
MVDIKREHYDPNSCFLSMEDFAAKINSCNDVDMALSRVQLVLNNYNRMHLDMPKMIQLEVAKFLRNEKWVDSPSSPSAYRLYKILKGTGRPKMLNFSVWLVVAAIWPDNQHVLEASHEMSNLLGQTFPGAMPFFPMGVSEDEAVIKYQGTFAREDKRGVSDMGNGHPIGKSKEHLKKNVEDSGDGEEDSPDHISKRKSDGLDEIFNQLIKREKKQKIDLTAI